jgi:hypothetical protein
VNCTGPTDQAPGSPSRSKSIPGRA